MKIYCKQIPTLIPGSQLVKKLGKYLYNNIDSATYYQITNYGVDVFFTVYYEIPVSIRKTYNIEDDSIHTMNVYINLATYSNKIRMNIINRDENEKTLICKTYSIEKLQDMKIAREILMKDVQKVLEKEYKDYDFIF